MNICVLSSQSFFHNWNHPGPFQTLSWKLFHVKILLFTVSHTKSLIFCWIFHFHIWFRQLAIIGRSCVENKATYTFFSESIPDESPSIQIISSIFSDMITPTYYNAHLYWSYSNDRLPVSSNSELSIHANEIVSCSWYLQAWAKTVSYFYLSAMISRGDRNEELLRPKILSHP